ncbi:MAG: sulfotransferase domain-containing protein [Deltaproteobacteria bacterium]|nr:sulfotransferase domain-containing protein [Deltaproteobacteria bacterium]
MSQPAKESVSRGRQGAPRLIHCAYHKCLTVYFGRVMKAVFNRCLPWSSGYRHYNSHLDDFYAGFDAQRVASVNNRALDLQRLGPFRISRFIRDPRDLIVSGYFYHKRGAEDWMKISSPTASDWYFANGRVPSELAGKSTSFTELLQSIPQEEGLLAEMEFRTHHLESMALWPAEHPHIAVYRYEDVVADGPAVFQQLFDFYGLSPLERRLGNWFARRYSLGNRKPDPHIRNPASGQWREHFTPAVRKAFDAKYAGLVKQLGYPAD